MLEGNETQFLPMDETLEEQEEKETSTDPSPETKPAETTPEPSPEVKQEDVKPEPVPFHEDPKIQEYISRQVENRIQGLRVELSPKEEEKHAELPSWWGGDEKQWGEFSNYLGTLKASAADEAIQKFKAEQESNQKALTEATNWLQSSINELKTSGEAIDDNTVNRIMKKVEEEQLVDAQGRWNYKAAFKLIKAEDALLAPKVNTEEKKKIAAATTAKDTDTPERNYKTPEDFAGGRRPWR